MGPIQQSINNLIFQTALIKGMGEKKEKEAASAEKAQLKEARATELSEQRKGVLEKRNQTAEEKLKGEQAKTQIAEEKLKIQQAKSESQNQQLENRKLKGQILNRQLEIASKRATQAANEEITSKYMQTLNFRDRHNKAIMRRMKIDEPHKPLPKKEE